MNGGLGRRSSTHGIRWKAANRNGDEMVAVADLDLSNRGVHLLTLFLIYIKK